MKEIEIVSGTFTLMEQNQLIQLSVDRIGIYEGILGEDGPDAENIPRKVTGRPPKDVNTKKGGFGQ